MGDVVTRRPLAARHTPTGRMSRRRRLDGEMHLAFGVCHGPLVPELRPGRLVAQQMLVDSLTAVRLADVPIE